MFNPPCECGGRADGSIATDSDTRDGPKGQPKKNCTRGRKQKGGKGARRQGSRDGFCRGEAMKGRGRRQGGVTRSIAVERLQPNVNKILAKISLPKTSSIAKAVFEQ